MRKIGILATLLVLSAAQVFGIHPELAPILSEWGLAPSEQKIVVSIFEDAESKKTDQSEMLNLLKKCRLKGLSVYDTSIELLKKMRVLDGLSKLKIPYSDDAVIMKFPVYLADMFTSVELERLFKEIETKALPKNKVRAIYETAFYLASQEIPNNDIFQIVYLLVRNGQSEAADLGALKNAFVKSAAYKISKTDLAVTVKNGLLKGKSLKSVLYELEK